MEIVYDRGFNQNEWFIIIVLILGVALVLWSKKRFSAKVSIVYFLYSIFTGMVFDHTISLEPFDFYDVNDTSSYGIMDFLSYLSYGAYGYFLIYFYDYFKVKLSYTPIYIFIWALIAWTAEFIAHNLGVFHYKNGYQIYYSLPIYLLTLISHIFLYRLLNKGKVVN